MQHAGETGRQKFLRHALRQHRSQAERVFHIRQVAQLLAHGFFGDVAVQRDEGEHHIALAEFFVHLLLGLIYRSALGVGDRLVAVSKVRHALRNIAGHDDHEHERDHRPPQLVGKGAERPPVLGNERAVLGFGNHVLEPQDERRHEQQHGDQAEENALGEHKAHIRPDAERISASARKPTMVVAPEAPIEEKAVRSALAMACSGWTPLAFSSVNACSRKIE